MLTPSCAKQERITAVHVEDSDLDAELFEFYIRKLNLPVDVIRFKDGQEAVNYFSGDCAGKTAKYLLVILDLGLPKISGQGVLKILRGINAYQHSPQIIILSGSANPRDREECHALGANDYFVKPFGLVEYENLIRGPIRKYLQSLVC